MKQNKKKTNIKIGIVGEHPDNDSKALIPFTNNIKERVVFKPSPMN
jgi:hypothetical protein